MSLLKHKFKLKDGSTSVSTDWYYRFSYKNKTYFGSTKTSNKTLAAKVETKKKQDLIAKCELGESENITVKQAFENYLSSISHSGEYHNIECHTKKLMGSKKDNRTGDGTGEPIKVFGFDAERSFDSITMADVQKLVVARRKEGNKDGTILYELVTFSRTIKINRNLGYSAPNINFAVLKKDNQIRASKGKLRYLSVDEEQRLLHQLSPETVVRGVQSGVFSDDKIRLYRQDIYDLTVILLGTGARYSEIANLPWKSVDLINKTIHIYRPKVKNESVLSMTKRVADVLTRRANDPNKDETHVFTSKEGGPRKYAPGAFVSACERAGIKGITLHSLRHTTASRLVQAGLSLYEVQNILGHASHVTTARYAHLVPNQAMSKAANALNQIEV